MRFAIAALAMMLSTACKTKDVSSVKDDASGLNPVAVAPHVCTDASAPGTELPCRHSTGKTEPTYSPNLLDNLVDFEEPFYQQFPPCDDPASGVELLHGAKATCRHHLSSPLTLENGVVKDYWFPTFYRDVTTSVAMYFCSYKKAQELMTEAGMPSSVQPLSMALGRSLIVFSSYRYNDVYGIPGYNEVAISIPTVTTKLVNVPIIPLLVSDWQGLGFYVVSMPVTTRENWIRGHKIWGLPKAVQEIDDSIDGDDYVTTVKERTGETYLQFRVPMTGKPLPVKNSKTYLYSILNGVVRRSVSIATGDFVTTKWESTLVVPSIPTTKTYRTFSNSPSGLLLQNLDIEPTPFQVRFAKGAASVFDTPDSTFAMAAPGAPAESQGDGGDGGGGGAGS